MRDFRLLQRYGSFRIGSTGPEAKCFLPDHDSASELMPSMPPRTRINRDRMVARHCHQANSSPGLGRFSGLDGSRQRESSSSAGWTSKLPIAICSLLKSLPWEDGLRSGGIGKIRLCGTMPFSGPLRAGSPSFRSALGTDILEIPLFVDVGQSWNAEGGSPDPTTLASVGTGIRWYIVPGTRFILYWGQRLNHVANPKTNLQDFGIHIQFAMDLLSGAEQFFEFIEPKGRERPADTEPPPQPLRR